MDRAELQAKREAFLALLHEIPKGQHSAVVNWFLEGVRSGIQDPQKVCRYVYCKALEQHARPYSPDQELRCWKLMEVMKAHRAEAIDFARWALWWETLTHHEKEAYRAPRREEYRTEWMANQPPTEKQLAYLRVLGYDGEVASRQHASELIEEHKK